MDDLIPPEALDRIFLFCSAEECLSNRRVCSLWHARLTGCALIQYSCPPMLPYCHNMIEQIRIVGTKRRYFPVVNNGDDFNGDNNKRMQHRRKRTRGHLPEPQVRLSPEDCCSHEEDDEKESDDTLLPKGLLPIRKCGTAFRLEGFEDEDDGSKNKQDRSPAGYFWDGINFAESSITLLHHQGSASSQSPAPTSGLVDLSTMRRSRILKNLLKHVDLCSVSRLERLSVKGCSNLQTLLIPTCLIALDASSCSRLESISMPLFDNNDAQQMLSTSTTSQQRRCLTALNINGSRKLEKLFTNETAPNILKFLKELDVSSVHKLASNESGGCLLSAILYESMRLESLSLRYVATNNLINQLAKSKSACGGSSVGGEHHPPSLQLVDVAFSRELQDHSVQGLITVAYRLERINLRGCANISGQCYNQTPVLLAERQRRLQQQQQQVTKNGVIAPTTSRGSTVSKDGSSSMMTDYVTTSQDKDDEPTHHSRRKGDNIFYFINHSI